MQVFRHYLLGRMKDNNYWLTRWGLSLQPYRYTIKYRAGKLNGNADGLSRVPLSDMDVAGEGEGSVMQHDAATEVFVVN